MIINDIVERVRSRLGWSKAEAAVHADAYVDFLSKGSSSRRPTPAIDAIWHEHILHTRRYRADCHDLLGNFVDHEPDGPDCSRPGPQRPTECTPSRPEKVEDVESARCSAPTGPSGPSRGRQGVQSRH